MVSRPANDSKSVIKEGLEKLGLGSFVKLLAVKFKWLIVVHMLCVAAFSFAIAYMPTVISGIARPDANIAWLLMMVISLNLCISIAIRIYHYAVWVVLYPSFQTYLSDVILEALLGRNYAFFQTNLSGDLSKKRTDIINELPGIYSSVIDGFLLSISLITSTVLTGLYHLESKYASYLLLWCVSFVVVSLLQIKKINKLAVQSAESDTKLNGLATDVMSNMLSVKLFARDNYEHGRFSKMNLTNKALRIKLEKVYYYVFAAYSFGFMLMLGYSAWDLHTDYKAGAIMPANVILFLQLSLVLVSRLWSLTQDMQRFLLGMGKVKQAYGVLFKSSKGKKNGNCGHADQQITSGLIEFQDVKFGYQANKILFDELNLTIESGEKVGLVGYSGAGKTSLVNLLLNLYQVQVGRILIDGKNVNTFNEKCLYESIAMITQDSVLFHRSVYENIAYGKLDATKEEVIQAAKKAQAHDFIMELEHDYDTNVGEKGSKLSGGQRQRVMIARSVLKNSRIIIMDEVTSQLDSENEAQIQKNLIDLMKHKTAIVIAHRLSTLKMMDRLLVFENGKIIGDGSHMELIKNNAMYRSLWNKQMGIV